MRFVPGDIFDTNYLAFTPPTYEQPSTSTPVLSALKTLTPLQGRVSAIHASMFFHLFDEEKQRMLACCLASLLSPHPGSMVFGRHIAGIVKGTREAVPTEANQPAVRVFCHSPESWAALWDGEVFEKGTVRVEMKVLSEVASYVNALPERRVYWTTWSVTRL